MSRASRAARHTELPRTDDVRHPFRGLLYPLRGLGAWYFRHWYDLHVHHVERLPSRGPVVVAANHLGYVDGPIMGTCLGRPVHAWTKVEMFDGLLGAFLRATGQIPLDRLNVDPRAVRTALRVLRDGHLVGVFPEGRRGGGELDRFHRGAAYLAMVAGAPVVPLSFIGTRLPGASTDSVPPRGSRIDVVVGHPIAVAAQPWPRTKDEVTQMSLLLHDRMLAELRAALDETGRSLPGPLPADQVEPDSPDDVTEERPA